MCRTSKKAEIQHCGEKYTIKIIVEKPYNSPTKKGEIRTRYISIENQSTNSKITDKIELDRLEGIHNVSVVQRKHIPSLETHLKNQFSKLCNSPPEMTNVIEKLNS